MPGGMPVIMQQPALPATTTPGLITLCIKRYEQTLPSQRWRSNSLSNHKSWPNEQPLGPGLEVCPTRDTGKGVRLATA